MSTVLLSIANICGRGFNFVLFLVIANCYGANPATDWFFFTYGIAYFFIGVCYYATESALVPVWHQMPEVQHLAFGKRAFYLAAGALPVIIFIMFFGALLVAPARGINIPGSPWSASLIIVILAVQPGIAFLASLFSSFHQYRQHYFRPTVHLALRTIGVLAVLALWRRADIVVLAIAFLAGEIVRLVLLWPVELRGVFQKLSDNMAVDRFWSAYRNVAWMTLALAGTVINPLVDLAMVGHLAAGSVTLVEYAGRLRGVPVLAFGGILVWLLGSWARQHYQEGRPLAWQPVNRATRKALLVCVPVVLLLMVSINWWVPLIFRSARFEMKESSGLANLLWWYFPGVPFLAGSLILSRALLLIQQARLLAIISLLAMIVNLFANLLFIRLLDLPGVALATTVVDCCFFGACWFVARLKFRQ